MKLLFCYLEHLDSLILRRAKRLLSWGGVGYNLTKNCAGIVGSSCYIFQFNCIINTKWQFLSCSSIAFSERYVHTILYVYNAVIQSLRICYVCISVNTAFVMTTKSTV